MTELPVDLDQYRGAFALKATEARRHKVGDFLARKRELLKRQQELEKSYLESPAQTWPEVGTQALYLIQILATAASPQSRSHKKLVEQTTEALTRLCAAESEKP